MLLTHPDSGPHHPTPIPRVGIEDVRAATARIGPYVRRTPLLAAAELSGAAAVAAWLSGRVALPPDGPTCALVCGAGTDGLG